MAIALDEDMTSLDTTIDYKVSLFLYIDFFCFASNGFFAG
jgi:hypothetical protein